MLWTVTGTSVDGAGHGMLLGGAGNGTPLGSAGLGTSHAVSRRRCQESHNEVVLGQLRQHGAVYWEDHHKPARRIM